MQRFVLLIVVASLLLVMGGSALQANDDAEPESRVLIRTADNMPLAEFVELVRQHLDIPLVWDPKSRALQGKQISGGMEFRGSKEEVLEGLRAFLTFYELVLIPVGHGENHKILLMDARQTAAIVKMKPRYVQLHEGNLEEFENSDGLFLTTTIQVENMENLRDARNALNRVVTGQNIGNITEVPAARAFVVTDFAPNVVAVWRLLKSMDMPFSGTTAEMGDREVVFQPVPLKHAKATEVAGTLVEHFGANAAARTRAARGQQQPSPDVPPTPALRIHADERLNQILVTGMRKDVDRVLDVVKAMDQPKPATRSEVAFIRLQHIRALDAAAALSQMVRGLPGPWLTAPGSAGLPAIDAHVETNGILIHADERAALALRRLIAEMDAPPAEEHTPPENTPAPPPDAE